MKVLCPELGKAMEDASFPKLQWLGHASFRIEWNRQVLLLDPVLAPRVSVAVRQLVKPSLTVLEGADDVLLSHAHMDHMDPWTLSRIPETNGFYSKRLVQNKDRDHSFFAGKTGAVFKFI